MTTTRAHMASFPARHALMLGAVARLAPQVDRLYICLNEYQTVPRELSAHTNVTAVIPDRDLKDLGKFMFPVDDEDLVFLVDDDITYPADYVAETARKTRHVGLDGNAFSYVGTAQQFDLSLRKTGTADYFFGQAVPRLMGVDILGTGAACLSGRHMPPLDYMAGAARMADLRFSRWIFETGLRGWLLPRTARYLMHDLPPDLAAGSIFQSFTRHQPVEMKREMRAFYARAKHVARLI